MSELYDYISKQFGQQKEAYSLMEEMAKELEILKADRDKLATQKRDLQQAAATRGADLERVLEQNQLLQSENSSLKTSMQSQSIRYEQIIKQLSLEKEAEKARAEKLTEIHSRAAGNDERTRHLSQQQHQQLQQQVESLESELKQLRRTNYEYADQLSQKNMQLQDVQSQLEQQTRRANEESRSYKEAFELLREEVNPKKRGFDAMESGGQLDTLRLKISQQESTISDLNAQLDRYQTYDQIIPQLKEEASHAKQMEQQMNLWRAEIDKLRERSQMLNKVQEELRSYQHRLRQSESLATDLANARAEVDSLKQQQSIWSESMHKMSQFQSVESIKDMMGDLQTQNRMLIETNGRLSSEMKGTLRMVSSLEAKLREESEKRAAADIETVKFKDIVRQKDVNNVVLKKEIEGLQSLLDSYTTDPMVTGDMTEALSQKEAHIKELMTQQQAREAHIANLNQELVGMREQLAGLQKDIDRVGKEKAIMEHRLGRGDYDPSTSKILHLKFTPDTMQRERDMEKELTALQSKCRSLEAELSLLKAEAATSSNVLVDASKFENLNNALNQAKAEAEELQTKLKDKEKSMARLSEVFTKGIKDFKESTYQLFGWKIEMADEKGRLYRIQSMFNRDPSANLLFEYKKNQMVLWETDFSQTIDPSVTQYLERGSIPAFLASLSLSLFHAKHGN